ncbi:unnamed protein product [Boreogadus saida]
MRVDHQTFKLAPREALAKSVLAEVPGQVVDFFRTMKLPPPPPPPDATTNNTIAPAPAAPDSQASAPSAAW